MRRLTAGAALAGAAAGAYWLPAAAVVVPRSARLVGVPTRVSSQCGVLLTFDDGPHPLATPSVLAQLDAAGAKAVFFLSGEQAARHPDLVRAIASAGHEIGVHGYRHQTRRQCTAKLVRDDTRRALDAIAAGSGQVPRLYRPPHGAFSVAGLRAVEREQLRPLLWTRWGRDWERRATADSIARRLTAGVRSGDVLLLHDADYYGARGCWRNTLAALPIVLEAIDRSGLAPAPLLAAIAPTDELSLAI